MEIDDNMLMCPECGYEFDKGYEEYYRYQGCYQCGAAPYEEESWDK